MKTWTVHVADLNPTHNPIVVEGKDTARHQFRRAHFVEANSEREAVRIVFRSMARETWEQGRAS